MSDKVDEGEGSGKFWTNRDISITGKYRHGRICVPFAKGFSGKQQR